MATRKMGKEGMGSPGDVRDRFRDAYKPGKHKPISSPLDSLVKKGKDAIKKLPLRIGPSKKGK